MKYIKKSKKDIALSFKVAAGFVFLLLCLSLVLSIRFVRTKKQQIPQLYTDVNLPVPQCETGSFSSSEITVTFMKVPDKLKIYYTMDGSGPDLSSNVYTSAFVIADRSPQPNELSMIPTSPRWKPPLGQVYKGTVIRAITVSDDNRKSAEFTRSFFIKDEISLPVISVTVNQKDLFGYNRGIYVLGKSYSDKDNYARKKITLDLPWWEYPSNYLERGSNSERPCHIEFYGSDKKRIFSLKAGLRINGNATRGFAQKALRVCFREKYGSPAVNMALFPSNPVTVFNSIVLRNSGNDWDKTMFRDGYMQSLMKDSHTDVLDYRPCVVFINGEYWGIHNIRERFDEHYLVNKYGFKPEDVAILEMSAELVYGDKQDSESFTALLEFVKDHDLSEIKNYEYVLSKVDIESFNDFLIANIFFCNSDWPNNNVRFWKYNGPDNQPSSVRDGRWRWMLYDTDWGYGYNAMSQPSSNLLEKATKTGSVGILFSALLKNETYRKTFIERFRYHLENTFRPEPCLSKIDSFKNAIAAEMPRHIDRWRAIESYSQWLKNIDVMKNFAKKRPAFQAEQLNSFFHLTGQGQISVEK